MFCPLNVEGKFHINSWLEGSISLIMFGLVFGHSVLLTKINLKRGRVYSSYEDRSESLYTDVCDLLGSMPKTR